MSNVPSTKRDSLTDEQVRIIGEYVKDFPARQYDQWKTTEPEDLECPPPYSEYEGAEDAAYWRGWTEGRTKLYLQIQELLNKPKR